MVRDKFDLALQRWEWYTTLVGGQPVYKRGRELRLGKYLITEGELLERYIAKEDHVLIKAAPKASPDGPQVLGLILDALTGDDDVDGYWILKHEDGEIWLYPGQVGVVPVPLEK